MTSDFKTAVVAVSAAIFLFAAGAASVEQDGADPDPMDLFATHIRQKETGVYTQSGWVFFHQRLPFSDDSMMAEFKMLRKAVAGFQRQLFATLDEMESKASGRSDPASERLKMLSDRFGGRTGGEVERKVDSLNTRVMSQGSNDGFYIYDVAVKMSALEQEAAKGRYSDRPETIQERWRKIVRNKLRGDGGEMEFLRDCGAIDLWTIKSAGICGIREVMPSNVAISVACEKCIFDLSESVQRAGNVAAEEYCRLLNGLHERLMGEIDAFAPMGTNTTVRTMLLSFGNCAVAVHSVSLENLDTLAEYADQDKPVDETVVVVANMLSNSPGCGMLWSSLGLAFLRGDRPTLALASFRNALRFNNDDSCAIGGMALAYERLSCLELAKGCACLALALSDDAQTIINAKRILSE